MLFRSSGLTGFDVFQWTALLAPAKTPKALINKLNADVIGILKQPVVRERLESAGFEPQAGSPQEVEILIREGMARWSTLVGELKLQLN